MWVLFLGLFLVCACAVTFLNRSVKLRSDLLQTPLAWKRSISSSQSSLSQTKYLTCLFHFDFDLIFAPVPPTSQLFFFVFQNARAASSFEKKKRMSAKKLSVFPLLAVEESDGQSVIDKYPVVVEKPAFWHLC